MERRVFSVCCAAWLLVCTQLWRRSQSPSRCSNKGQRDRHDSACIHVAAPRFSEIFTEARFGSLNNLRNHEKPTWLPLTVSGGAPEAVSWGREGPGTRAGELARPPRFALRSMLEQRGYTRIRVRRMPSGYIRIAGKFGSTDVALLVDTGSSQTLFDRERAIALGLIFGTNPDEPLESDQGARGVMGALEIGSIRTRELFIAFYDFGEINRAATKFYGEPPVDGVLGGDLLGAHLAVVDYADGDLYLLARNRED